MIGPGLATPLLLLATAVCASGGPARRVELATIPCYLQETIGTEVEVRAYVRSAAEPGEDPRATGLLAAWLARGGSRSFSGKEFAVAANEVGLVVTAFADGDLIVFEGRAEPRSLRRAMRLLADVLMYPSFDPTVADTAWADAIRGRVDSPDLPELALRDDLDRSVPSYPRPDRDAVVALHRKRFGRDAMVLAISGPIAELDLEKDVRDAFTGFHRAEAPTPWPADQPGRTGSVARSEELSGFTRLIVARTGLHRTSPRWLEVEIGVLASLLAGESELGEEDPRILIQQSVGAADRIAIDRLIPRAELRSRLQAHRDAFLRVQRGSLPTAAIERARSWLALALIPSPETVGAARANALLECFGAPAEDPAARHQRLLALKASAITVATSAHLRAP